MVDQEQIEQLLNQHFSLMGRHTIANGVVHVKGDVYFVQEQLEIMPVQFGTIDGELIIRDSAITTLKGSPKLLNGGLIVSNCKNLTSCVGAPEHVDSYVRISKCPLKSLEGFPPRCDSAIVEYEFDLPLLRLLQCTRRADLYVNDVNPDKEAAAEIIVPILHDARWRGKGKSGMLNCALELKKAGYAGNARW